MKITVLFRPLLILLISINTFGQTPRNVEILRLEKGVLKVIAYQRCEVVNQKEKCQRKGKLRTLRELRPGEFIVSLPYRGKVGVIVKDADGEELR